MADGPAPFSASDEPAGSARQRQRQPTRNKKKAAHQAGAVALTLGALGVVFGDIGTSPLYALQAIFSEDNGAVAPNQANIYGVISLVFWAITIIVSVKYVTFIMKADNEGEGGIMALIALVQRIPREGTRGKFALVALGIFGAALFYGDGMITPAISVLSAVEGLSVVSPSFDELVVPIALVIIVVLFASQRFGTGAVGRLFGPVMLVWFTVLGVAGLGHLLDHPEALRALSPHYGIEFFIDNGGVGFLALGGVVLAVTGAEALYADMGHFGHGPIRRAWFLLVFPALTLNYLGQGSLLLDSPKAADNPFFLLFPHWSRIPVVVLATLAAVIASQAVISGAFSVTRQAVQLNFLPRLAIHHTSQEEVGQVYAPGVNGILFVAVTALVVGFGSSAALAAAYGIAVTGTLAIDTILFFVVARLMWRRPVWMVVTGLTLFLTVDLAFFGANVPKIVHGGWFPLTIAAVVFLVLMTWQKGRGIVTKRRTAEEGKLRPFIDRVHDMKPPVHRVEGTAVFLNANPKTVPLALRQNVEHNRALHESVVILSVEVMRVPHVPPAERVHVDDLGYSDDGITHIRADFGFQDEPNVPDTLLLAVEEGLECDLDLEGASYFVSRITLRMGKEADMQTLRKRLFLAIARTSSNPIEYFGLPLDRTVTMGGYIDV